MVEAQADLVSGERSLPGSLMGHGLLHPPMEQSRAEKARKQALLSVYTPAPFVGALCS